MPSTQPTPARETGSTQRHVGMARTLAAAAARAGLADFSSRRAAELVSRATVRRHDTDVFAMLAGQRESRWRDPLDDVGEKDLLALVRAMRRAGIREGEPAKPGGRKRGGARTQPHTDPDVEPGDDLKARDLRAMDDGLDAIAAGVLAELDEVIASTRVAPIASVEELPRPDANRSRTNGKPRKR